MHSSLIIGIIGVILIAGGAFVFLGVGEQEQEEGSGASLQFSATDADRPSRVDRADEARNEARGEVHSDASSETGDDTPELSPAHTATPTSRISRSASRTVQTTDGTTHSIPLDEILGGGPPKDGIPSIDDPKFEDAEDSGFADDKIGIGLNYKGEKRFYPFEILVWHEIVNDTIAGDPVLVTYCPLCQTGVVFERHVNGTEREFGVSGQLWRSNLLMYDRTAREEDESLWSQVLGEAVVGTNTGTVLPIISSDIVRWGGWKQAHPDTEILKRPFALRPYGTDPYGSYYTSREVGFGAAGADTRGLHPKTFVHGIEINGRYSAYVTENIPTGVTTDTFAGEEITITKSDIGEVSFSINGSMLEAVGGFWFSWVAVHPETELWQGN